eukprot:5561642-Heterocapsa_arctica.AAC.1
MRPRRARRRRRHRPGSGGSALLEALALWPVGPARLLLADGAAEAVPLRRVAQVLAGRPHAQLRGLRPAL